MTAVTGKAPGFAGLILTYDDGPDPHGTEAVLKALAEKQATATFFVLLSRVRRYRTLMKEVLAGGHEIALHGLDHKPLTSFGREVATTRTASAKEELEDAIGRAVRWFRPPYGRQTISTWYAVRAAGLIPVLWTTEYLDWVSEPDPLQGAGFQAKLVKGAIVLAHDGFASKRDGVNAEPAPDVDRYELSRKLIDLGGEKALTCSSIELALRTARPQYRLWLDNQKMRPNLS